MSQKSRILKLLQERPRTTREILDVVPSIVHSRIAQLRDEGHNIVCTRTKGEGAGGFLYTLVAPLSEPAAGVLGPPSGTAGSESGVSECLVCGQQMLGLGLRCDDCKSAVDGSEAPTDRDKSCGGLGDDELHTAASLPSTAGEQLRLVA